MIVVSEIINNTIQIDKRRIIDERHVDEADGEYVFNYMAEPGMDVDARLQQRAAELNEQFQYLEDHAKDIQQELKASIEKQIDDLQEQLADVAADVAVAVAVVG